jgi:hypothetical protein
MSSPALREIAAVALLRQTSVLVVCLVFPAFWQPIFVGRLVSEIELWPTFQCRPIFAQQLIQTRVRQNLCKNQCVGRTEQNSNQIIPQISN